MRTSAGYLRPKWGNVSAAEAPQQEGDEESGLRRASCLKPTREHSHPRSTRGIAQDGADLAGGGQRAGEIHRESSDDAGEMLLRVHVTSLEVDVHVPFILGLVDFFMKPISSCPLFYYDSAWAEPYVPTDRVRLDVVASHLQLTVMNHTLGPSIPLLKLELIDGYMLMLTHVNRVHLDFHLPIEAQAYNARLSDFETLIEPVVVGMRLRTATKILSGLQRSEETQLWLGSSALRVTATRDFAADALRALLTVTKLFEEDIVDEYGQWRGFSERANAHAIEFLRSPYWARNMMAHTAIRVAVRGSRDTIPVFDTRIPLPFLPEDTALALEASSAQPATSFSTHEPERSGMCRVSAMKWKEKEMQAARPAFDSSSADAVRVADDRGSGAVHVNSDADSGEHPQLMLDILDARAGVKPLLEAVRVDRLGQAVREVG